LRFKEFEGEWVEKRLGDEIKDISSGKSKYKSTIGNYPFYGSKGVIANFSEFDYSGEKILIARVGAYAGALYKVNGNYSISDNTLVLEPPVNINLDFIFSYLLQLNLNQLVFGSGQPLITGGQLKLLKIFLPSFNEQIKIANFLTLIDQRISTQSKIIQELKSLKSVLTKKIFARHLRFKDQTTCSFLEWESKKLGEVAELTSSKRVYLADYVAKGIPFYRGKEISELKLGIEPSDLLYIAESAYLKFKKDYGVPMVNDLLMTAVGTLGNVLRIKDTKPFYFKDGNLIWFRKITENSTFLEILLKVYENEIKKSSIGSTQRALTMVELRKLTFPFPCINEQEKIAKFLSAIDEKIKTELSIEELLAKQKQYLLSKLFI
jgi:restriction endonuclease S subunit